ncbi:hypothetical protein J4226_02175 [Candidatus Pacearchaeota archaeon]|nr:hypothetical protein [Candidatus Pacearchaeota archaeon]
MKPNPNSLDPISLATSTTILVATLTLFATILAAITNIKTITPLLQILYSSMGYNISIIGSLLGAFYVAIDTFILAYLFAWLYNKLL